MKAGKQGKGFTLIELMIVVAIIAIIATFAYPSYQESVRKGYRSEGKAKLLEVSQQLERCYTQENKYGGASCIYKNGDKVYSGETGKADDAKFEIVVGVTNDGSGFTLTAAPQYTDKNCGGYTLDSTGKKGIKEGDSAKDFNYCW